MVKEKKVKGQFLTVFRSTEGKYPRFWISVSKKDKDSDEYKSANISAILSDDAKDTFDEECSPTANKSVQMLRSLVTAFWLTVKTGQKNDEVAVFINELEPSE